jgi:hypothetical protein
MSETVEMRSVPLTIHQNTPELWHLQIERIEGAPPTERATVNAHFDLVLGRIHERHIGVGLDLTLSGVPWLKDVLIGYRMFFLVRGVLPASDLDAVLLELAGRVGPMTIFPYIRETLSSVSQKSGRHIPLPTYDWDTVFPASSIIIPEPDGPAPAELLEPVDQSEAGDGT